MTTQVLERCSFERKVELRAAPEGSASPGALVGYAAVFNQISRDLGGWAEEIDPGAFGPVAADGRLDMARHTRVMCRAEHLSSGLLGTTDAGTLRLYVDNTGLRYEVDLPATSRGRDIAILAERGDIRFSSFAFYTLPGGREWREDSRGMLISRVMDAILVDVAPVADPAYWGSSSELRTLDLEAIRAQLHPEPAAEPAPDPATSEERAAVVGRAHEIEIILEGSRHARA